MIARYSGVAAFLSLGVASAAEAACERHIYNQSSQPWTVQAFPELTPTRFPYGNVYFGGACGGSRNGPCTVAPNSSLVITYTTTDGISDGLITFRDNRGVQRGFNYRGLASNCPYVAHSGNTGAVSVNAPANGDFAIGRGNW